MHPPRPSQPAAAGESDAAAAVRDVRASTNGPIYYDIADLDYTVYEGIHPSVQEDSSRNRLEGSFVLHQSTPPTFNTNTQLPLQNPIHYSSYSDGDDELIARSESSLSHAVQLRDNDIRAHFAFQVHTLSHIFKQAFVKHKISYLKISKAQFLV